MTPNRHIPKGQVHAPQNLESVRIGAVITGVVVAGCPSGGWSRLA
jgi:hypothetical protein